MPRDPRLDPVCGDVLFYGPQWQSERIEVRQSEHPLLVRFERANGVPGHFDLRSWREYMIGAEVIALAELPVSKPLAEAETANAAKPETNVIS